MRFQSIGRASVLLGLLSACGGKVFIDLPGSAGGGGSGVGGNPLTSTTGTGETCDDRLEALAAAIAAARVCNPAINSIQCDGSAIVEDACGCSVLLNEKQPNLVQAAKDAHQAVSLGGCLVECEAPCIGAGPGFCQPDPNGSATGTCNVAFPD